MKLSLNWLREYVDIDLPVPELARRLIDATAEVESWESLGAGWEPDKIRVAEVLEVRPHPNADRLRLVTVETGAGPQQVVCGAPNVAAGQRVAFATEGAKLIDGHTGQPAVLKLRPIRGVDSAGMVLSEKELGLSDDHEGILVFGAAGVDGGKYNLEGAKVVGREADLGCAIARGEIVAHHRVGRGGRFG